MSLCPYELNGNIPIPFGGNGVHMESFSGGLLPIYLNEPAVFMKESTVLWLVLYWR
jgi:hypothetical protein